MENHPIDNLIKNTMENLKDMIDVNTIIGDPIESKDGYLIIPISKLSFGFASGGSEFSQKDIENVDSKFPFGGGSGAGVTVKPIAFLVIKGESIRLLPLNQQNTCDKIVDSFPQIIDMIKNTLNKNKKDKKNNNSNDNDNSANVNNTTDENKNNKYTTKIREEIYEEEEIDE